jgi:Domain of unknown function (DUF1864)
MSVEVPSRNAKIFEVKTSIIEASGRCQEDWDPLSANAFFANQCTMRQAGTIYAMRRDITDIVQRFHRLERAAYTREQNIALLRDLSMVVTIVMARPIFDKYHIPVVAEIIPGADEALQQLADETGFAPRNTDDTYVDAYLDKLSSRKFTDTQTYLDGYLVDAEHIFRGAVRFAKRGQERAIPTLVKISQTDIMDPALPDLLDIAREDLSDMSVGIAVIERHLPRDFFAPKLLPFLKPYMVKGKEYFHSGSQMPGVLLADRILWAASYEDKNGKYQRYYEKNKLYVSQQQKESFAVAERSMLGRPALVDELMGKLTQETEMRYVSPHLRDVAVATYRLLLEVNAFRSPHAAAIARSMKDRPDGQGSAGDIDMPPLLLARIKEHINKLKRYYFCQTRT